MHRFAPKAEGQPPLHVAIVMDGNGRWATNRGLPRTLGHRKGIDAVQATSTVALSSILSACGHQVCEAREPKRA